MFAARAAIPHAGSHRASASGRSLRRAEPGSTIEAA
jgi:hypothetical protein